MGDGAKPTPEAPEEGKKVLVSLGNLGATLAGILFLAGAAGLHATWAGPAAAGDLEALGAALRAGEELAGMPRAAFGALLTLFPCMLLGVLGVWFVAGAAVSPLLPRSLRDLHDPAVVWLVFTTPCAWTALLVTNLLLALPAAFLGGAGAPGAGLVVFAFVGGNLVGGLAGLIPASWLVSVIYAPRPD